MSETSLCLEFSDLRTVKIVCAHCRAAAELPVAPLEADPPERCFHCRAEWFPMGSPQATALQFLFQAFVQLRQPDVTPGCRVQLVIRADSGPAMTRMTA